MSNSNKPFFSKNVLDVAERVQRAVGHSDAGRAVVRIFTGSPSPVYEQLNWRSQGAQADVPSPVLAPGNIYAGKFVRHWYNAAIIGAARGEVADLKSDHEAAHPVEAITYKSSGIWHIGVMATDEALFAPIPHEPQVGVAMRVGSNDLTASMGLWLPEQEAFVGFESTRLVQATIPIGSIPGRYPSMRLT